LAKTVITVSPEAWMDLQKKIFCRGTQIWGLLNTLLPGSSSATLLNLGNDILIEQHRSIYNKRDVAKIDNVVNEMS